MHAYRYLFTERTADDCLCISSRRLQSERPTELIDVNMINIVQIQEKEAEKNGG